MSYELQLIDTNCNDCIFMQRDFVEFKKWEDWSRDIQLKDYNKEVAKNEGKKIKPFQFDKSSLLHYGNCEKFNKKVSFIPVTCTPQNKNY